jgi:outer membrane lipoprotein
MKNSLFLILSFLLVVAGCAHNISKKSLALVDQTITFDMLREDPDTYRGKLVVFGGNIDAAQKTAGGIRLEIIQHDLDSRELPDETVVSRGRFLAIAPDSLKIAMCRSGKAVSVAGEVAGREVLSLKGADYTYPVIIIKEMHLFPLPGEDPFHTWSPDNPR